MMPLPLFQGQCLVQSLWISCIFKILHVKILSICIPGNEMRVVWGLLIFFTKAPGGWECSRSAQLAASRAEGCVWRSEHSTALSEGSQADEAVGWSPSKCKSEKERGGKVLRKPWHLSQAVTGTLHTSGYKCKLIPWQDTRFASASVLSFLMRAVVHRRMTAVNPREL